MAPMPGTPERSPDVTIPRLCGDHRQHSALSQNVCSTRGWLISAVGEGPGEAPGHPAHSSRRQCRMATVTRAQEAGEGQAKRDGGEWPARTCILRAQLGLSGLKPGSSPSLLKNNTIRQNVYAKGDQCAVIKLLFLSTFLPGLDSGLLFFYKGLDTQPSSTPHSPPKEPCELYCIYVYLWLNQT